MSSQQPSAFQYSELNQNFARLRPYNDSPELEAVLSKLVPDERRGGTVKLKAGMSARQLSGGTLQRISQNTLTDVQDAKSLLQLLPDLELAMQILISSILSPKDLVSGSLTYRVDGSRFNSEVTGKMLEEIENFFNGVYKINDLLPKILEDVLFKTGSYPILILPESSIDEIINAPQRVSLESVLKSDEYREWTTDNIGLLGPAEVTPGTHTGLEDFGSNGIGGYADYKAEILVSAPNKPKIDLGLRVIDNPTLLKRSRLQERIRRERVATILNSRSLGNRLHRGDQVAIETINASSVVTGFNEPTPKSFSDHQLYNNRSRNRVLSHTITIPTPSEVNRPSVGHPLVMRVPSEAVIPVHVPGDPENHVGYFLLVDEFGNFVCLANSKDYYTDMGMMLRQNSTLTSQLINTTNRAANGRQDPATQQEVQELQQAYTDMVEMDLNKRLRNGVYGENVQIARPTEVYRLMLARTYAQRRTQLLWVPAEMLTYIAFDFDEYGVGESLLSQTKIIGGIRATLLFANAMSGVKNSIARTRLKINLDPDDPEPDMTVEEFIHHYVRNSRGLLPIGINEPNDILQYLANASVEVEVSGGNPRYPETSMLVEDYHSDKSKPDPDFAKDMHDYQIMGIGLPPEMVTNATSPEFATTVVNNNLLLTKRVMTYQSKFLPYLAEFIQRYTINSEPLMNALREIVKNNVDKLSRQQLNESREAVQDGRIEVDEDIANLIAVVKDSSRDSTIEVDSVVYEFIASIMPVLPKPDVGALNNQKQPMDDYAQMVDEALKYVFDPLFLDESVMGELSSVVGPTREALKAHYMRQWMRDNNVMPEISNLSVFSDKDGPALDLLKIQASHIDGVRAAILRYMEHLVKKVAATNTLANKAREEAGVSDTASSSSTDFGGSDTSTDSGSGEFDFSDDFGGDSVDAAADDSAPDNSGESTGTEEKDSSQQDDTAEKKEDSDQSGSTESTESIAIKPMTSWGFNSPNG